MGALKKKAGGNDTVGKPPNWPDNVTPEDAAAWRRNRTQAGRDELLGTAAAQTAAEQVAATNPPNAAAEESANTANARRASTRTRRRASAGSAGRVTTGPGGTPSVTAGGAPRTLIGL